MPSIVQPATLELKALYGYDAFNRRVLRVVIDDETYVSSYDGWRDVQEGQLNLSTFGVEPTKQFVRGAHLDEVLAYRKRVGASGSYSWDNYFVQHGGQDTSAKVLDDSGALVEQYEYGAYGALNVFSASGASLSVSAGVGLPVLWKGIRLDAETGLYYMRNRYYSSVTGRFCSKDPIGSWGDELNSGNPYAYAGGRPGVVGDPLGLQGVVLFPGLARAVNPKYDTPLGRLSLHYGEAVSELGKNPCVVRVMGAVRAVGGAAEAAGGVILGVGSEGLAAPLAIGMTAHGLDQMGAGLSSVWTGVPADSLTSQGLQAMGMSQGWANGIDTGLSLTSGGIMLHSASRATPSMFNSGALGGAARTGRAGSPTVRLYHGGRLQGGSAPNTSRSICLTDDLSHAQRFATAEKGTVFTFDVPLDVLDDWIIRTVARPGIDNVGLGGVSQIKIDAASAPLLGPYMVR
tara:strand:+ start:67 stop:1443 length:1377 start_codon:yes stop_codon:yes gene_type:complete